MCYGFGLVRLVLRREIAALAGDAVLIRAAHNLQRLVEVAMRRRGGRLPLQRGRIPRVVRSDFLAPVDAPEEIDDEWNLRQTQGPDGMGDIGVETDDGRAEADDIAGGSIRCAAVIKAPNQTSRQAILTSGNMRRIMAKSRVVTPSETRLLTVSQRK